MEVEGLDTPVTGAPTARQKILGVVWQFVATPPLARKPSTPAKCLSARLRFVVGLLFGYAGQNQGMVLRRAMVVTGKEGR
jgi:hypothetical protein